jgi:tetratricopeptide (TPR) repeat protein
MSTLILGACSPADPPTIAQLEPQAPPSHVGRQACAECHAEQSDLWLGSHHDLAMQPATAETVLGDFVDATFAYAGMTSTFFRQGEEFWVRTDAADGALREFRVAYTFGVEPLQQYLIEMEGGRLQALSICWDTRPREAGGERWFHLYPDEVITAGDPLHWTGIYQNWNFMCAECHSTNLQKGYDLVANSYQTTWSEIDVSCEACHGPGSRHVKWAEAGLERRSLEDTLGLVAPLRDRSRGTWAIGADSPNAVLTRAGPRLDLEACARCHSRRTPVHPEHQPGEPFLDGYRPVLLEEPLYHADGQILDEVYVYGSFLQSRMHQRGVTCNDCHEPHSLELRGTTETVCAQCHSRSEYFTPEHHRHAVDSAGAACVECHMPATTYMQVDARRDHSFRVPRPDLSLTLGTPNACTTCHTDHDAAWAATRVAEWFPAGRTGTPHFAEALHAARESTADAETQLIGVASNPEIAPIVRATALAELSYFLSPGSLPVVEESLRDPEPLVRLAALTASEGADPATRMQLAMPLLDDEVRAVRVEAARILSPIPREALSPEQSSRLDLGIEEYKAAQRAVIDRPEAHLNLGTLAAQQGDTRSARAAFDKALEMSPGSTAAALNLADLERQEGRDAAAIAILEGALERSPEDPRVHHALGLALVRLGSKEEALVALERAASLQPREPRYGYVYGVALYDLGQAARGLQVLEDTHQRSPGHRDTLVALFSYARNAGDREAMRRHGSALLELTPQDGQLRALLEQLDN